MPEPDDEFDEIVQRLDLDLDFPDQAPPKARPEEPEPEPVEFDDIPDEPFYRRVTPRPPRAPRRGHTLGWIAVLGSPAAIMVATFLHIWLSRPVLLGIGLTFVAGAIYLISQLPEHGPSRPDWPDDGAAL
jgi:hypothetical protein